MYQPVLRKFDPVKLKNSKKINLDDPLTREEKHKLLESMRINGQLEPGIVYRGECVDGRNRKAFCRLLRRRFEAYEYPDETPMEVIADIIDQKMFTGRDYTPERRQRKLLLRFGEILRTPDRLWKGETYQGKLYKNKKVYISLRSGIPMGTLDLDLRAINSLLKKEKPVPRRWLSLTGDQSSLAKRIKKEYKGLEDHRETLKAEFLKRVQKEVDDLQHKLRDKASEIPGGLKRILNDKSL